MVCDALAGLAFHDGAEADDAAGLPVVVSVDDCRVEAGVDVGRLHGLLPSAGGNADALDAPLELQAERKVVAVGQ